MVITSCVSARHNLARSGDSETVSGRVRRADRAPRGQATLRKVRTVDPTTKIIRPSVQTETAHASVSTLMEVTEFLQKKKNRRALVPTAPKSTGSPAKASILAASPAPLPTPVGAALAAINRQPPRDNSLPTQAPPAIQPPIATCRSLLQPQPTQGTRWGGALCAATQPPTSAQSRPEVAPTTQNPTPP